MTGRNDRLRRRPLGRMIATANRDSPADRSDLG